MKIKLILCAMIAGPFALCTYLICSFLSPENALLLAVLAGALMTLGCFTYFLIFEKRMAKSYARAERRIPSPVFYRTVGNFDLGRRGIRNGNIYFCEDGIMLLSLDTKPHLAEWVPKSEILSYESDIIHLTIRRRDGGVYLIAIPDAQRLTQILKETEWLN